MSAASVDVGEPRRRCRGDRCGDSSRGGAATDELGARRRRLRARPRTGVGGRRPTGVSLGRDVSACDGCASRDSGSDSAGPASTSGPMPVPARARVRGPLVARDRELDLVHLGARRRRFDRLVAEGREVGLDRGADALAVARHVLLERVGVGPQRVATRAELGDLRFEAAALALGDAARGGLGFADQRLRLGLGLLDQLRGLRLRLVDRVVGGALREQQRALQHLGVVAARRDGRGGSVGGAARRARLDADCVRFSMVTAARSRRSSTSSRW